MPKRPQNPNKSNPWSPLKRTEYSSDTLERVRETYGAAAAEQLARAEVYQNDRYEVALYRMPPITKASDNAPVLIHLSVKRRDRGHVRDWRDLQRIKNELLGPEHEAVELYPAESRLVDAANQFHLWGFDDPTFRFPFGFADRLVSDVPPLGGKQRPR